MRRIITVPLLVILFVSPMAAAEGLTDPTRPSGFVQNEQATLPRQKLDLASIMIGDGRKSAIINNEVRHEGDRFSGITVRRIKPDRVEVIEHGSVRVLRLDVLPDIRN